MSIVYFRFAAHGSDTLERAPLLEALLVRAARAVAVVDWRADALRVISPNSPAIPAIAAIALKGRSAAPWACIATPLHWHAGMSHLSLPAEGILSLDAEEAALLALDFNGLFGVEGVRMRACAAAVLVCEFDEPLDVHTHDPEMLVGRDLFALQATGPGASRLRRLMSEVELWLFDHAVNRARTARGMPQLNGLWFWGGGATSIAIPPVRGWTAGRDPLFASFGDTEWPGIATRGIATPAVATPGVIVTRAQPGTAEWRDVEQCWLEPAWAALEAGALESLALSAGGRCFHIDKGLNLRFWRRARPWWESFEVMTGEVE